MDTMEEKLNSVLANPDMMRQIMQMAQSLTSSPEPPTETIPEPEPFGAAMPDPALLQKLAAVAQRSGIDPEDALHCACDKFDRRFRLVEEQAQKPLTEYSEEELVAFWKEAKQRLDCNLHEE